MRVIPEVRRPGMQHGEDRGAGAEMLGIGRDAAHRLGRGAQARLVPRALVRAGDGPKLRGPRAGDEAGRTRQAPSPVEITPAPRLLTGARGAVPVATGVVAVLGLRAVVALPQMPAPRGGATGDEVVEGPAVRRAQTAAGRLTRGGSGRPDNVGDREHARAARLREAVHQVLNRIDGGACHLGREVGAGLV